MVHLAEVLLLLLLLFFGQRYRTDSAANERSHVRLEVDSDPLKEVQVQHGHYVYVNTRLRLSSIHNHGLVVRDGAVIFAGRDSQSS